MDLRAAMKARHVRPKQIADALGVSVRRVGGWMYGEREPCIRHLIAIADVLQCTVDELVRTGTDEKKGGVTNDG